MTRPEEDGFFMPAEWAPHKRCWMAWPAAEEPWGDYLEDAKDAYADLAQTIAQFEPVTLVTAPENLSQLSVELTVDDELRQKGDVDVVSIDELIQLVERVCFQIWALSAFQPDPVKSQLRKLVEPVCGPPTTLVK